jgi:hypothetical protein
MPLDEFELRMMDLEQRLRPIADRPVDITKPGWGLRLKQFPHPFDEAGVRPEAETLVQELINVYRASGEDEREAVRKLFEEYRAFAWAASLPFEPTTEENFRQHLLLFSIKDQGRDSRDAIVLLQDVCERAKAAGVNTTAVLKNVATLSSDKNKFGMGSTKGMLLKAC